MSYILGSIDKSKELNGVWFDFEGSRFLVARWENHNMRERFETLKAPYKRKFERGESAEKLQELMIKAASECVLLDWEGVQNLEGESVTYEPKHGEVALTESRRLRDAITAFSLEEENYFKDMVEK